MNGSPKDGAIGFWKTVGLLLRASRRRATGRQRRQQQLLSQKGASDWNWLGMAFAMLFMIFLNGIAAFTVDDAVVSGQRFEAERGGKILVSREFLSSVRQAVDQPGNQWIEVASESSGIDFGGEAQHSAREYGGDAGAVERKLRASVATAGDAGFAVEEEVAPGLNGPQLAGGGSLDGMPGILGSLVLLWWAAMLVFQGEGLEMDLQRRRHPMWEWVFSHPVQPGAVFLAEMLSPIASNPAYWGGPLFAGVLFGRIYGVGLGLVATFAIGVPMTVALACVGKALEIGVTLRVPARTRGGLIGLMSWFGYASMMGFLLSLFFIQPMLGKTMRFLVLPARLPWPWLRLLTGVRNAGSGSFATGMLACWIVASAATAAAIAFSAWGAQRGLAGNFAADTKPARAAGDGPRFGREPLYRKEMLWFARDRSAIVQTILIPLTVAGLQAFNLRGLLEHAQGAWNYLCGVAILFGTYFLWVLGPKSLASEGTALWIALTWPRGLESLLKAKAWLWSLISSGIVALVLLYAALAFPGSIGKIALVGVGWWFFGRSMAEKSVTLVTVASESGEVQRVPRGRAMAAQLGMVTFSVGVLTEQWNIAVVGIVYSYLTAAAMWQNFRARLPYLYDPWSEVLPEPPTLMHAMVSISILLEVGALLTGMLSAGFGREHIGIAEAMSYAICSVGVAFSVATFLGNRGVRARDIWVWRASRDTSEGPVTWWQALGLGEPSAWTAIAMGMGGGLALGAFGRGYMAVLARLPWTAEAVRATQEQMAAMPELRWSYAAMAVLFAPWAEEYLFRGLLFRALDREWGGWRAVLGGAAFFAIYHAPAVWLPVGLLGAANCLLFKKTGRLTAAVAMHLVYNAVVLS